MVQPMAITSPIPVVLKDKGVKAPVDTFENNIRFTVEMRTPMQFCTFSLPNLHLKYMCVRLSVFYTYTNI